jgi:hypothetical protein
LRPAIGFCNKSVVPNYVIPTAGLFRLSLIQNLFERLATVRGGLSDHNLFRVKRLRHTLGGAATNPAQSSHRKKRIVTEPGPLSLARKMPTNYFDFPPDLLKRQGHEQDGIPKVPIVLRDFILEDEMVTEGIMRQLGNQPVILMSISCPVCQDKRWVKFGLDRFEVVLDLSALEREIAIAEFSYVNSRLSNPLKESRRAVPGFCLAGLACTENDPSHRQIRDFRDEAQNGPTATDLNVIGMGP